MNIIELDFNWLYKFFTYSSIQVKFISTFLAIIIFIIIRRILVNIIYRQFDDARSRYRWQKATTYLIFTLGLITVGRVWFKGIESIATYLGLVSAGVAIALKDPITNITGWLFIVSRSPFSVGDRVEIGPNAGDVIDINFFKFTIMEIGNWIDGDSNTGRVIHIPNGKVFTDNLANYGSGFRYIFNELPILVTFESNWSKAKIILEKIVEKHTTHISKVARSKYEESAKIFMMPKTDFNSKVYTRVEDSGINLTVRFLCNPRKRRQSSQVIWEEILEKFSKENDIEFAYPTIRYYDNQKENPK